MVVMGLDLWGRLQWHRGGSQVEAGGPSDVADSWRRRKGLFL
jgi:hypothetical protein